jgi:tetratricopeptide (TPR) repeat protein
MRNDATVAGHRFYRGPAFVVAIMVVATAASPQQGGTRLLAGLEPYLAAVNRYQAGQFEEAAKEVLVWSHLQLTRAINELRAATHRLRVCPERPDDIAAATLEGMVMLHTDAALVAHDQHDLEGFDFHLNTARRVLEWYWSRGYPRETPQGCTPRQPVTRRDWYVATIEVLLGRWEPGAAVDLAEFGVFAAPNDPEMLLAAGSAQEAEAIEAEQYSVVPRAERPRRVDIVGSRRKAAEFYRRAVVADPRLHEAQLRLGRILLLLNHFEEARRMLQAVIDESQDPSQVYLGYLFIGRAYERSGLSLAALDAYRKAVELQPSTQASRLALAHALKRAGNGGAARRTLLDVLVKLWPREATEDPWWAYPMAQYEHGLTLMSALRQKVTQP